MAVVHNKIQAWPFLVSRNRTVDYRTVVAPDFIIDARRASIISGNVSREQTNVCIHRHIEDSKIGWLTLFYHVTPAVIEGAKAADSYGRQIYRIEGVVLKGRVSKSTIDDEVIHRAHESLNSDFERFWMSNDPLQAIASQPLNVAMPQEFEPEEMKQEFKYKLYTYISIVIILMLLMIAALLWLDNMSLRNENKYLRDQIERPQ